MRRPFGHFACGSQTDKCTYIMSSTTNAYDVDPENQIEVGYMTWKAETDCELRLLPEYDSDGEPIQCICGTGSGEGEGPTTLGSTESPAPVKPLFICGPAYSVADPDILASSESPAPIQPQWVPLDEGHEETSLDDFYYDYFQRVREYEAERDARVKLYSKWCLEAWVNVASNSLDTDEAGREAFRLLPNWPIVETLANAALASYYRGPGDPPRIFG